MQVIFKDDLSRMGDAIHTDSIEALATFIDKCINNANYSCYVKDCFQVAMQIINTNHTVYITDKVYFYHN